MFCEFAALINMGVRGAICEHRKGRRCGYTKEGCAQDA